MITPEQALAIYRAGAEAVVKVICDLSRQVDLQQRQIEALQKKVTFLDQTPRVIQQMEIEEVLVLKEEHRSYPFWCESCQQTHYSPFPKEVLNVDETGHKENAGKFWTWVFRADLYVLFEIDKSRGSKVLLEVLGADFNGVRGCDYFSAYLKYMRDCNITVQFCIAHLIRNIKYLTGLPDVETKAYGKAYFEFITTPGIGPTNNLAEQAVRYPVNGYSNPKDKK